tara:strand:+ start:375 stop:764 length:390 start_codon:yes stop_codon:yes gene_type:complete
MKPTQEKILSSIQENKSKKELLSVQKVDLTAYSDVVTQMKHAENLTNNEGELSDMFNKLTTKVRTQVSFSKSVKNDLSSSLKTLENSAKELGVKPDTIDIYKKAQALLKHSEVQEKLFTKMLSAVSNFG